MVAYFFKRDALSYLENNFNEGTGLFPQSFPKRQASATVEPGELREGNVPADSIPSYWINPMPIKCKV